MVLIFVLYDLIYFLKISYMYVIYLDYAQHFHPLQLSPGPCSHPCPTFCSSFYKSLFICLLNPLSAADTVYGQRPLNGICDSAFPNSFPLRIVSQIEMGPWESLPIPCWNFE